MDMNKEKANVNLTSTKVNSRKTVWDHDTHMTFVELCIEEVKKGNRPGSTFNKVGWTNLVNNLKVRTEKVLVKDQLKNHWDSMKRDWKLYDRLIRIESGLGWDHVKKTIDATPEWWDEKIQVIYDTIVLTIFPRPIGDKYYIVDVGYPNTRGYLAPYKGNNIRYHIPDFRRGKTAAQRAPKGTKETFNFHHSSLRNVIERTFGVWKARWAILKDMHVNYSYETQVNIVIASMAIHNYIRIKGHFDEAFEKAQQENYCPTQELNTGSSTSNNETQGNPCTQRRNDDLYMSVVRDRIAKDIMESK